MIKQCGLASALALAALCAPALAQTHIDAGGTLVPGEYDVSNATYAPLYCQVTVTATATSLASLLSAASCAAAPAWASFAFLTPESSAAVAIRYRADGTAPTASIGEPILGWQTWPVQGVNALSALSLISSTGASVTADIEIRG